MMADPDHVAISKSKGITIHWKDGHVSQYSLAYLRDHCPCASCTGAHGAPPAKDNPLQLYKPVLKMNGVERVGNYAIRILWSDGHSTGLYSWEHFREICPCEECRGE